MPQGFSSFLFRDFSDGKRCGNRFWFCGKDASAKRLWIFLKRCPVEMEKMCKEMWKSEKAVEPCSANEKNEKQNMYIKDAKLFFRPGVC